MSSILTRPEADVHDHESVAMIRSSTYIQQAAAGEPTHLM
jgi:hypothetical protein